ncbi:helix-turn-helix transcriptional regulator [Solibacillus silvestris]|uniref:helix-turn-helix transcriptional regulator n=1 Tax=Solibacillus silvestris TaxID=76853 RepID=UPI003F7DF624
MVSVNNLKELRKVRGMPLSELSRRTGLSRVSLRKIENNEVNPKLTSALVIAREFNKSVEEIFFIDVVNQD